MGQTFEALCNDCGHVFSVSDGGGVTFHLVRCNRCGKTKQILFEEIADLHFRYLKGLPGPYSGVTSGRDEWIKEGYDGEPIPEKEYYRGVEEFAGRCDCKGEYEMDAPCRCPKCYSLNIEGGESFENEDSVQTERLKSIQKRIFSLNRSSHFPLNFRNNLNEREYVNSHK